MELNNGHGALRAHCNSQCSAARPWTHDGTRLVVCLVGGPLSCRARAHDRPPVWREVRATAGQVLSRSSLALLFAETGLEYRPGWSLMHSEHVLCASWRAAVTGYEQHAVLGEQVVVVMLVAARGCSNFVPLAPAAASLPSR